MKKYFLFIVITLLLFITGTAQNSDSAWVRENYYKI